MDLENRYYSVSNNITRNSTVYPFYKLVTLFCDDFDFSGKVKSLAPLDSFVWGNIYTIKAL